MTSTATAPDAKGALTNAAKHETALRDALQAGNGEIKVGPSSPHKIESLGLEWPSIQHGMETGLIQKGGNDTNLPLTYKVTDAGKRRLSL